MWLGDHGYDPDFGARPLRRVIQREIGDPLALALLEGRYRDGRHGQGRGRGRQARAHLRAGAAFGPFQVKDATAPPAMPDSAGVFWDAGGLVGEGGLRGPSKRG